jgi:Lar family restriction alleviation protein
MTEAALKPCPFCGGEAEIERLGDHRQSTIYQCTNCGCSLETSEEWGHGDRWNERARPAASGDLRERITGTIRGIYGVGVGTFAGGHQDKSINRAVDAILASLPSLDEEAIRSDERERCAVTAENHSFARDIEWWLTSTKKDVSAESCHSVADAIRSRAALQQQEGRET